MEANDPDTSLYTYLDSLKFLKRFSSIGNIIVAS